MAQPKSSETESNNVRDMLWWFTADVCKTLLDQDDNLVPHNTTTFLHKLALAKVAPSLKNAKSRTPISLSDSVNIIVKRLNPLDRVSQIALRNFLNASIPIRKAEVLSLVDRLSQPGSPYSLENDPDNFPRPHERNVLPGRVNGTAELIRQDPTNNGQLKTFDNRSLGTRPVDARPVDGRPVDGRPVDIAGLASFDNRFLDPTDTKSVDTRQIDSRPIEIKSYDTRQVDYRSFDRRAPKTTSSEPRHSDLESPGPRLTRPQKPMDRRLNPPQLPGKNSQNEPHSRLIRLTNAPIHDPNKRSRKHSLGDISRVTTTAEGPLSNNPFANDHYKSHSDSGEENRRKESQRPDEYGASSTWKTATATFYRQKRSGGPFNSSTPGDLPSAPMSPCPSAASSEYHREDRRTKTFNKLKAAMSIYPNQSEAVALIRDVIFCLQGVEGQHLRFNPEYERFLLRRGTPLSRPLRILASRMVAPGNSFLQIHFHTAALGTVLGDRAGNLTSLPINDHLSARESLWIRPSGEICGENCQPKVYDHTAYRFMSSTTTNHDHTNHRASLVVFAFLQGVRDELDVYYRELGDLESNLADLEQSQGVSNILETLPAPRVVFSSKTLRKLVVRLKPVLKRIHCLSQLVSVTAGQIGAEVLSTLNDFKKHGDPTRASMTDTLFDKASIPLATFLRNWILEGKLHDEYEEFFFQFHPEPSKKDYYSRWRDSLSLDWEMVPSFYPEDLVNRLFAVGKMAYFIRLVNGASHFEHATPIDRSTRGSALVQIGEMPLNIPRISIPITSDVRSLASDEQFDTVVLEESNNPIMVELPLAAPTKIEYLPEAPNEIFLRLTRDLEVAEKMHRHEIKIILLDRYNLIGHLEAVKAFLLLGKGDFAEALMEETSELVIRMGSVEPIVQSEVDTCIENAINSSIASKMDYGIISNLHAIRLTDCEKFGKSSWDFFTLDYDISNNPVSVVIRDELRAQYRRVFAFLWKLRRTTKIQHSTWLTTMHNSFLLSFPEVFDILLEVQSLRNEIMHLLQCLESFIFVDIIQPAFQVLITQIKEDKWQDLDALIDIHESFLQTVLYGAFLDEWPAPNTVGLAPRNDGVLDRSRVYKTLPDVNSSFLSASCAFPAFSWKQHNGDGCLPDGARLMDALLECASSFAALMVREQTRKRQTFYQDHLQIAAYEIIAGTDGEPIANDKTKNSPRDPAEFFENHVSRVESIREKFTFQLFEFIDFLKDIKANYRSEATGALLIRLDLSDFYGKLKSQVRNAATRNVQHPTSKFLETEYPDAGDD